MNRTASDGHETLRSLLLHTGDPLPLVLALDDMDPDDPLTKKLAADIVRLTHNAAVHLLSTEVQRERLTINQKKYWQRNSKPAPTLTTPADAIRQVQEAIQHAAATGKPLVLSEYDRYQIAGSLPGPPIIFIQSHAQPEPHTSSWFHVLLNTNQAHAVPQMQQTLEPNLNRDGLKVRHAGDYIHLTMTFRGHTVTQGLRLLRSLIDRVIPDAHIYYQGHQPT